MPSRRDFLKFAGGVLGGGVYLSVLPLTMGQGARAGSGTPLPNGYAFYRIFSTGEKLPDASTAHYLSGLVKLNDNHQIIFHAGDEPDSQEDGLTVGIYEYTLDLSGSQPVILDRRKVVREGDELADGNHAIRVNLADHNDQGSVAVRLQTAEHKTQSIYLERNRAGFNQVVGYNQPAPHGESLYSSAISDFDLYNDDNLLVVAHHYEKEGYSAGEGLFYLPGPGANEPGRILVEAGDLLPGSNSAINKLGLTQGGGANGSWVVQAHTESLPPTVPLSAGSPPPRGSAIIGGSVNDPGPERLSLMAASTDMFLSQAFQAGGLIRGSINYGPRIGSDGQVAAVVHETATHMKLYHGGNLITSTGGKTPTGRTITSLGGPAPASDGLVYYVGYSADQEELLVSNGETTASLLSSGGDLLSPNGAKLLTIAFGSAKDQVDSQGRLVFIGEFADQTLSVILGIPV
jgi:hypothetical protein